MEEGKCNFNCNFYKRAEVVDHDHQLQLKNSELIQFLFAQSIRFVLNSMKKIKRNEK